jgi:hypothetical protein
LAAFTGVAFTPAGAAAFETAFAGALTALGAALVGAAVFASTLAFAFATALVGPAFAGLRAAVPALAFDASALDACAFDVFGLTKAFDDAALGLPDEFAAVARLADTAFVTARVERTALFVSALLAAFLPLAAADDFAADALGITVLPVCTALAHGQKTGRGGRKGAGV